MSRDLTKKQLLKDLHDTVQIHHYLDYKEYLEAVYRFFKSRLNPFSYEVFSEHLGFARSNIMYLISKGKRPLTEKNADRIRSALHLTGLAGKYWDHLVTYQTAKNSQDRDSTFAQLVAIKHKTLASEDNQWQLEFFNEWYHAAIYELTFLPTFRSDGEWIATNLMPRVRPDRVRASLELLEKLELIHFDKDAGRHFPTRSRLSTGDEIASLAVQSYHKKMIDLAQDSLVSQMDSDLKDITSATLAIPADRIEEFKQAISVFRKQVLAMADAAEHKDTVYQLNVQFFPITKKTTESA